MSYIYVVRHNTFCRVGYSQKLLPKQQISRYKSNLPEFEITFYETNNPRKDEKKLINYLSSTKIHGKLFTCSEINNEAILRQVFGDESSLTSVEVISLMEPSRSPKNFKYNKKSLHHSFYPRWLSTKEDEELMLSCPML